MHFCHMTKYLLQYLWHNTARDSKRQASKGEKSHKSHSGEQAQMRSMTQVCSLVSLS